MGWLVHSPQVNIGTSIMKTSSERTCCSYHASQALQAHCVIVCVCHRERQGLCVCVCATETEVVCVCIVSQRETEVERERGFCESHLSNVSHFN